MADDAHRTWYQVPDPEGLRPIAEILDGVTGNRVRELFRRIGRTNSKERFWDNSEEPVERVEAAVEVPDD